MKLHVGSGAVYLTDYINVDVPTPHTFLATERPDLVDKLRTTDDQYYARHQDKTIDSLREGPLDQEYVCDRFGHFGFLPVRDGEVSEIVSRHAFEHASASEAKDGLRSMWRALNYGGVLRLDVPNHNETLRLLVETGDSFYIRHLVGPQRGEYGFHMQSYTRHGLRSLVESRGFKLLREEENIHLYPSISMAFVKI